MSKTMLVALFGLTIAACAHPDDEDSLLADERSIGSGGDEEGGCAGEGDFDLEEFAGEILPILNGDIDLNNPEEPAHTGCARGPCHGQPRPDGFFIDVADTIESNLERFACFADLERPKRSQILVCPSGDDRCVAFPHPGPEIFTGRGDLNYKRILAYIKDSRP